MSLGGNELAIGDAPVGHDALELVVEDLEQLRNALGRRAGIDRERAGLLERRPVGVDGVGEATLLAYLLEEARGHPAAEDLVQDGERIPVGIVTPDRSHAE